METTTPKKFSSKVPQHLRPFHHASRSSSDLTTKVPAYSFAPPKPADPIELCPTHWQLPEKIRLRHKLRAILLKDWQSLQSQSPSPRRRTPERPTTMRMKESNDYITARAANPRTGLISPSLGSPSPRAPLTPESPGEALKIREAATLSSQTPDFRARPTLRRANEGRRVSAGGTRRANENGWLVDGTISMVSPRVSMTQAGSGLLSKKPQPWSHADQLVMHMPSAREPQPYAFPGYSAKQIKAYEHYKQKARKVSSEGYDQRILQAARQPSGGRTAVGKEDDATPEHIRSHPTRIFSADAAPLPNLDITVLKRRARMHIPEKIEGDTACVGGAELNAANLAPLSSPKSPTMHSDKTNLTSLAAFGPSLHTADKHKVHTPVARKLFARDTHATDLRSLPQVSLAHPSVAAVPRIHQTAIYEANEPRKCSFGCVKDSQNGICMASKGATPPRQRMPLFEETAVLGADDKNTTDHGNTQGLDTSIYALYWLSDLLVHALVTLFELGMRIHLPRISVSVLQVLRPEHAQPQQKLEAMEMVLFSTGQALGLITAIVMVWNMGSIFMHMLEIVLWPLTVPFRILRWLVGG